jgi:hypothetical protein
VDDFGTGEVTFVTLLKGNWLLGILLSHQPFLLDRCLVSGSLVGIPRWLPVDGFEALHRALQARKENRCVLTYLWYMSFSKDLVSIFVVLGRCSETSQPIR